MNKPVLVDSNVILDIATEDPVWLEWSLEKIATFASQTQLIINPIIYAEVSVGFERIEALDDALPPETFRREGLPFEAGFLAGKAFVQYKQRDGKRLTPLPDFHIGAHAAIQNYVLLTRDASTYRSYYPSLEIVSPT